VVEGNYALSVVEGLKEADNFMKPIVFDINEIMKLLPHRFPFLLVDRIIFWDGEKKMVGLKNVTINEPFFQGHFPGRPIMPGVLIVEAMAQVTGIALRNKSSKPQLGLFMSLDNVKFRKPVAPGDQLRLEVELKRFGGRVAVSSGQAFVGEDLVAEADMMFGFAPEAK